MNKNTLRLTTGALFIAIFAMLLFINQQTGFFFEELVMYILPMPMAAYSVKYGFKSGLPVMLGMILISVLFGTPTTIFYAASESLIGLVMGTCLYKKVDANITIVSTVLLSIISNLLNTVILASLFGYNIPEEIAMAQQFFSEVSTKFSTMAGEKAAPLVQVMQTMMDEKAILMMIVFSMIVVGAIQGYVIYVLSILILKRLRFQVEKPKSIYSMYPPKILGVVLFLLSLLYIYTARSSFASENLNTIAMVTGMSAYSILLFFGFLFFMLIGRVFFKKKIIGVLLSLFLMPYLYVIGAVYIVTNYHKKIMEGVITKDTVIEQMNRFFGSSETRNTEVKTKSKNFHYVNPVVYEQEEDDESK